MKNTYPIDADFIFYDPCQICDPFGSSRCQGHQVISIRTIGSTDHTYDYEQQKSKENDNDLPKISRRGSDA